MEFEKDITKYLGIPGAITGFLVGLWRFFKFFINRSLNDINNRIENIENNFKLYEKSTDKKIEILFSKDKEIEVNRCLIEIENIENDIKDMRRQIGAMWERIEKEYKEVNKQIAHIEGYMEAKREK